MTNNRQQDVTALIQALLGAVAVGPEAVRPLVSGLTDPAEWMRLLSPMAGVEGLRTTEPQVLGNRVDFSAYSESGGEWCVVLEVSEQLPLKGEHVSVFERPPPFAGIPGGFVIVVKGPSSSGKSSLMAAFCDLAGTPWTRFDELYLGEFPLRFAIWPEASGPIREGFLVALSAFARVGNQIITTSGSLSKEQFRSALIDIPSLYVRLDCPLEVLVERQNQRGDRWAGLAEEMAAERDDWSYDLRIDTSVHAPEDAARILIEHVTRVQIKKN